MPINVPAISAVMLVLELESDVANQGETGHGRVANLVVAVLVGVGLSHDARPHPCVAGIPAVEDVVQVQSQYGMLQPLAATLDVVAQVDVGLAILKNFAQLGGKA